MIEDSIFDLVEEGNKLDTKFHTGNNQIWELKVEDVTESDLTAKINDFNNPQNVQVHDRESLSKILLDSKAIKSLKSVIYNTSQGGKLSKHGQKIVQLYKNLGYSLLEDECTYI